MRLSSSMHNSISKCLWRHHSPWISALFLGLATSSCLMPSALLNVFSHDFIDWGLWINLDLALLVVLTDLSCLVDWTSRFLRTQFPSASIYEVDWVGVLSRGFVFLALTNLLLLIVWVRVEAQELLRGILSVHLSLDTSINVTRTTTVWDNLGLALKNCWNRLMIWAIIDLGSTT